MLFCFSMMVCQLPKFGLSLAMVCMVRPVSERGLNFSTIFIRNTSRNSPGYLDETEDDQDLKYEFEWGTEIVGLILSSPYFTSFLSPIFGDFGRQKLGSKLFLTVCTSLSACIYYVRGK